MSTDLDLTKPIQTRDGRKAEFLRTIKGAAQERLVVVITEPERQWVDDRWTIDGFNCVGVSGGSDSDLDLINVPPKKHSGWVNIYRNAIVGTDFAGGPVHSTQELAERERDHLRRFVDCIHIEFTEGEGLTQ